MTPANDNFSHLPLFATDDQLGAAIVGKAGARRWAKEVLPTLRNFPPIDSRHQARPVPLVRKWYDSYLGVAEDFQARAASGEENLDVWTKKRKRAA
jgi:hypothetical protein